MLHRRRYTEVSGVSRRRSAQIKPTFSIGYCTWPFSWRVHTLWIVAATVSEIESLNINNVGKSWWCFISHSLILVSPLCVCF